VSAYSSSLTARTLLRLSSGLFSVSPPYPNRQRNSP
jgi:hypothetical protein